MRCHIRRVVLRHKKCLVITFVIVLFLAIKILCGASKYHNDPCPYHEPIDVVYTWVNGSDPIFLEKLNSFNGKNPDKKREFSNQRFDDKYELKFSLRSLEKYAPWIRHVFIVTNGQIPYWLNLDYEKVTLITHEEIFPDHYDLPTFSSPAIEVHLHRIPNLSKRFIYFNDDMFLGAPMYMDDFYTDSRGYLIYLAWPLPMCATDCPWIYIADGQCDNACFNIDCQMDGGDCDGKDKGLSRGHEDVLDRIHYDDPEDYEHESNLNIVQRKILSLKSSQNNNLHRSYNQTNNRNQIPKKNVLNFILGNYNFNSIYKKNEQKNIIDEILPLTAGLKNVSIHNNALLKLSLNSTKANLTSLIEKHNRRVMSIDKLRRKRELKKQKITKIKSLLRNSNMTLIAKLRDSHNAAEAYSMSLQHTNRIFNTKYGFTPRYVPAHTPIMIDKDVMQKLQNQFENEYYTTSRNRIRASDDMQYSFSYYYYLIHEKTQLDIGEVFDIFDTDESGTWSDREIRTLLSKLYDLPLSYMIVDHFEYILTNCSKDQEFPAVPTPEYERYIDSKLPTISKQLVTGCAILKEALVERFGTKPKYRHETLKNTQPKYVNFKMLTSNISEVVGHLDEIRRKPSKFVCLNDNLDYEKTEENELVKAILYDFYLSLFAHPSKFELSAEYRNRFLYKNELTEWKSYHFKLKVGIYFFLSILCYFSFLHLCKRRILLRLFSKIFY